MRIAAALAACVALAGPAAAQAAPEGLPLSQVLAAIEAEPDFAAFESVDWDDDHWEIEYRRADGSEVDVEIDPVTGEPRAR